MFDQEVQVQGSFSSPLLSHNVIKGTFFLSSQGLRLIRSVVTFRVHHVEKIGQ
jgi:hypothetical protein